MVKGGKQNKVDSWMRRWITREKMLKCNVNQVKLQGTAILLMAGLHLQDGSKEHLNPLAVSMSGRRKSLTFKMLGSI